MSRTTRPAADRPRRAPRLLLTRPALQSEEFAVAARERLGANLDVIVSPVLEIVPLPLAHDPAQFDGLVLSSRNALASLAGRGDLVGTPIWCVGRATAAAAAAAGLRVEASAPMLADLASILRNEAAGLSLLHLHGRHVTGDLAASVGPNGPRITKAVVYDQRARALEETALAALAAPSPLLVPVFSPRSATLLASDLKRARAPLLLAAMSPAVASVLPVQGLTRMETASTPDAEGMLRALQALLQRVKPA